MLPRTIMIMTKKSIDCVFVVTCKQASKMNESETNKFGEASTSENGKFNCKTA